MVHPDTYTSTTSKGISLFAKRKFKKGEILWVADTTDSIMSFETFLKLSKKHQRQLAHFCYLDSHHKIISPCDNGKYVNHSCSPNCTYLMEFDNISIAIKDIEVGEEITENYCCYYKHLDDFECKCGAKNCVGALNSQNSFRPSLRLRLDEAAPFILQHQQLLLNSKFESKTQFIASLNKRVYEYC